MGRLHVATEGPCAGHLCDNCRICQSGRCCRRDNPDYRLPELGEWDGPIYGTLGNLADDGEKVECHCCGKWFGHLGSHVWQKHNLTPDEYRAIFGLNVQTGLIGPALAKKRADHIASRGAEWMTQFTEKSAAFLRDATPEQHAAWGGAQRRLQHRIDPALRMNRQKATSLAREAVRNRLIERGAHLGIDQQTPYLLAEIVIALGLPPADVLRLGFGAKTMKGAVSLIQSHGWRGNIDPLSYTNWLERYGLREEFEAIRRRIHGERPMLSDKQKAAIIERIASGRISQRTLAEEYGVSRYSIQSLLTKRE